MNWVELIEEPERVLAPDGVVYSTAPTWAYARDSHRYYVKGPDTAIVAAEALGYLLAQSVGLPVPQWALCRHPRDGGILFASRAVSMRSGIAVLSERGRVVNPELIGDCFAFDVWTANGDRNDGNFVAESLPGGKRVQLLAIDFESAKILRGVDRFSVAMLKPRELRPKGLAGRHCFAGSFPLPMCNAIAQMTPAAVSTIMDHVSASLGAAFTWRDAAADYLLRRAANIRTLADEVWNA